MTPAGMDNDALSNQDRDLANDANSRFGWGPRYLNRPTTFAPFSSSTFAICRKDDPAADL